jgi:hypothetical protein
MNLSKKKQLIPRRSRETPRFHVLSMRAIDLSHKNTSNKFDFRKIFPEIVPCRLRSLILSSTQQTNKNHNILWHILFLFPCPPLCTTFESSNRLVWLPFLFPSAFEFTNKLVAARDPNSIELGLVALVLEGTGSGLLALAVRTRLLSKVAVVVRPTMGLISWGWRTRRRFFGSFDLKWV